MEEVRKEENGWYRRFYKNRRSDEFISGKIKVKTGEVVLFCGTKYDSVSILQYYKPITEWEFLNRKLLPEEKVKENKNDYRTTKITTH